MASARAPQPRRTGCRAALECHLPLLRSSTAAKRATPGVQRQDPVSIDAHSACAVIPRRTTAPAHTRMAAGRAGERPGRDATDDGLLALGGRGRVAEVADFKEGVLSDVAAAGRLGTAADGIAIVAAVVAERQAWLADSITTEAAADWLS